MLTVGTDAQREMRRRDLEAQDRDYELQQEAKKRENRDFVQVYPKGWKRLQDLK